MNQLPISAFVTDEPSENVLMTAKNTSDSLAIVQGLMEQLAKTNADNSVLQCKLAAERMITAQIFEAMKVIDPNSTTLCRNRSKASHWSLNTNREN